MAREVIYLPLILLIIRLITFCFSIIFLFFILFQVEAVVFGEHFSHKTLKGDICFERKLPEGKQARRNK